MHACRYYMGMWTLLQLPYVRRQTQISQSQSAVCRRHSDALYTIITLHFAKNNDYGDQLDIYHSGNHSNDSEFR